jgi:hypothetical protein
VVEVRVTPEEYQYVEFDADRIAAVVAKLCDEIGLQPEGGVSIAIDESTPMAKVRVTSTEPLQVEVEGGAFEDPKRPRKLSDRRVADSLARMLFRARDRLDPAFGDPPADDELTLPQATAWDAYCLGRFERLGYQAQKQRRLYNFRNRHGFNDVADAHFERLWNGTGITWADIEAVCAETGELQASA